MIKFSEILTILVQGFLITLTIYIPVCCLNEVTSQRKRGKRLREYTCKCCGYSAWALDHIFETKCHNCGSNVKTEPVPTFEGSSVCNEERKNIRKGGLKFKFEK